MLTISIFLLPTLGGLIPPLLAVRNKVQLQQQPVTGQGRNYRSAVSWTFSHMCAFIFIFIYINSPIFVPCPSLSLPGFPQYLPQGREVCMLPWEATQWCYCKPSINLCNTSTSTFYVILTWVVVWTYWLPFEHLCILSRVIILTLNVFPVSANHISANRTSVL